MKYENNMLHCAFPEGKLINWLILWPKKFFLRSTTV